jgi:hypothetical protein
MGSLLLCFVVASMLVLQVNPYGHFAPSFPAPLVKPIGGNEATPFRNEFLEQVLLAKRFRPCVYHALADRRVWSPRRHQAPAHGLNYILIALPDDYGNCLAGAKF